MSEDQGCCEGCGSDNACQGECMDKLTVVVPAGALGPAADEDRICTMLRTLSELTGKPENWPGKYGSTFENDTFAISPYYWGDCTCGHDQASWKWSEDNKHADGCYQNEYIKLPRLDRAKDDKEARSLCDKFGIPWNDGKSCAVHCTCGHQEKWLAWIAVNSCRPDCPLNKPNFLYKKTGWQCSWYKYIGRGMECSGKLTLREAILMEQDCLKSMGAME